MAKIVIIGAGSHYLFPEPDVRMWCLIPNCQDATLSSDGYR